ncbi:hypothetical protein VTK56DRAFT_5331 [Thermocarpiscus australiensis]
MENVLTADTGGNTPLHVASAMPGREGYVAALLEGGADVHGRSANCDKTAADLAYVGTLALLIWHGAKPLRKYLTLSLDVESVELAANLLERGMEFQTKDLQLVEKRRFSLPFTRLLLDRGAKVQSSPPRAGNSEMDSIVSALIAARFLSRQHFVEILTDRVGSLLESLVATVENDGQGGNRPTQRSQKQAPGSSEMDPGH